MKNRFKVLLATIVSFSLLGGIFAIQPKEGIELAYADTPSYYEDEPSAIFPFATYDGNEHPLIVPGVCSTGTIEYKVGEDGVYSTEVPTAVNAGVYEVYYRVKGNDGYEDIEERAVPAIINKADCVFVAPTLIEGLVDDFGAQMINPGSVEGGTLLYKKGFEGEYSTEVPYVTKEGTFVIFYMVEGDENHNDISPDILIVVVESNPNIEPKNKGGIPVWMIPTLIVGILLVSTIICYLLGFFVFNSWIKDGDKLVRVFKLPGKDKTKVVSMMMQFKEVKPEDIKKSKKDFK